MSTLIDKSWSYLCHGSKAVLRLRLKNLQEWNSKSNCLRDLEHQALSTLLTYDMGFNCSEVTEQIKTIMQKHYQNIETFYHVLKIEPVNRSAFESNLSDLEKHSFGLQELLSKRRKALQALGTDIKIPEYKQLLSSLNDLLNIQFARIAASLIKEIRSPTCESHKITEETIEKLNKLDFIVRFSEGSIGEFGFASQDDYEKFITHHRIRMTNRRFKNATSEFNYEASRIIFADIIYLLENYLQDKKSQKQLLFKPELLDDIYKEHLYKCISFSEECILKKSSYFEPYTHATLIAKACANIDKGFEEITKHPKSKTTTMILHYEAILWLEHLDELQCKILPVIDSTPDDPVDHTIAEGIEMLREKGHIINPNLKRIRQIFKFTGGNLKEASKTTVYTFSQDIYDKILRLEKIWKCVNGIDTLRKLKLDYVLTNKSEEDKIIAISQEVLKILKEGVFKLEWSDCSENEFASFVDIYERTSLFAAS